MTKIQEQILRIMEGLRCTKEEATAIYEADKAIDRNEKMPFDLEPTKAKEALKNSHLGTKHLNLPKKERKPNLCKGAIIAELAELLRDSKINDYQSVTIANKERQIDFIVNGFSFSLTLTQHRK